MTHFFQYAKVNQHQVTQLEMSNSQVMLTQEKLSYSPFKWDYIKVIESKSKIAKGSPFDLIFYELKKLSPYGSIIQA